VKDYELYTPESDFRADVEEVLRNHGYDLDTFAFTDKPKDDGRTVTIKAVRNLKMSQQHLPMEVAR
jgi:hypothetical protein